MTNFATTRWSLVYKAVGDGPRERREAMQELLTRYLPALHAHLVRRKRLSPELADELLQAFVLKNILEGELLQRADQTGGKFRSWLLKWLENYVRHELSRRRREVSVEQIEDLHEDGEADAFEIEWARRTLQEALQIMQTECEVSGKHQRWQVFQARIIAPLLTDAEPTDYAQLVSELGLESTAQVQNLLVTAKRHFTRSLETVVGRYADSQEEITAEIADLRRLLVAATSTEFAAEPMPGDEAGEALAGQARPDQVAKFLDLDYRHVWQRYLQKPLGELLPAVEAVVDKSPTLGELLQAPDPDLTTLKQLKLFGSLQMQSAVSDVPTEIALAIYLTAIAAAAVQLRERISHAPLPSLRSSFRTLLDAGWLDEHSRHLMEATLDGE